MVNPPAPKNLVITGGAQGIGRFLTYHFFRKGHRVCVPDTNVDGLLDFLHAHRAMLSNGGLGIIALEKSRDLPPAICTARQGLFQYEDIDVLINVVGGICPDGPDATTVDHDEALERWQEYLVRVGVSEDVVETIEFLLEAGFVNGADIVVDGGAGPIESSNADLGGWSLRG